MVCVFMCVWCVGCLEGRRVVRGLDEKGWLRKGTRQGKRRRERVSYNSFQQTKIYRAIFIFHIFTFRELYNI